MPLNLPNILTVTRIVVIFVSLGLANFGKLPDGSMPAPGDFAMVMRYIAYALAILAGITDHIDGFLARKWNQITDFGALMDPLADKIFVTAAMVILVDYQLLPAWIAAVVISREFLVTGLRLVAIRQGRVISADRWGKLKTVSQMVMLLFAGLIWIDLLPMGRSLFGAVSVAWIWRVLLWIVVVITIGSGCGYFYKNRDLVSGTGK